MDETWEDKPPYSTLYEYAEKVVKERDALQRKLDIAVEALEYYKHANILDDQGEYVDGIARKALKQLEDE